MSMDGFTDLRKMYWLKVRSIPPTKRDWQIVLRNCWKNDWLKLPAQLRNLLLHCVRIERLNEQATMQSPKAWLAGWPVSHMSPLVHAIRITGGKLDGGADAAGDGMAAAV